MLRLLTLGSLSVHGTDGPLAGSAAQPRRLAILGVVARGGQRGASRAKLRTLLWPDASDEQGRRVITQALYALRRDLGHDECIVGTQELRLNRDSIWCDVEEFDAALGRGDAASAASLYGGPFLDGFRLASAPEFERWADDERRALQHRLHDALETLARSAEASGSFIEAAAWWRRRAADDPLNARITVAIMRALAAAGDRVGALRQASLFEALIAEELGLPPDRHVVDLANELRAAAHPSAPQRAAPAPSRTASSVAVLPFAILGRNRDPHDDRPWCDALAEEMITALLDVPGLRVVARSASFALGPSPGLSMLRGELAVSHAVEGSVRRTASGLRVNVRLIEANEGHAISWHRFDCPLADAVTIQEQIATQFAQRIREVL